MRVAVAWDGRAVEVGDALMCGYGWSGQLCLAYSQNGSTWGWNRIEAQQTVDSVGLTYSPDTDQIWCAFRGTRTGRVFLASSPAWEHIDTGVAALVGPGLAAAVNGAAPTDVLMVAFLDDPTSRIKVLCLDWGDARYYSGPWDTGESSHLAPAIVEWGGIPTVAYIGEDSHRVEVVQPFVGGGGVGEEDTVDFLDWGQLPPTGQSSRAAPAMAAFKGELWVAYLGEETNRIELISFAYGAAAWSQRVVTTRTSSQSPAMAVFQEALYVAYVGVDDYLEVITSADGVRWEPATWMPILVPVGTGLAMITAPAAAYGVPVN
jgi:hypothetical protein